MNTEKYGYDLFTELRGFLPTVFICIHWRRACEVMYMMIFQLLGVSLMGKIPFAMTSSLTNDRQSDNERSPPCTFSLERCLPR